MEAKRDADIQIGILAGLAEITSNQDCSDNTDIKSQESGDVTLLNSNEQDILRDEYCDTINDDDSEVIF